MIRAAERRLFKMVYLILANGFEETEALCTLDVLRRAEADVATVGICGEFAVGTHGVTVKCDIDATREKIDIDKCEMLIFPGGMPGAENIDKYEHTDSYIEEVLAHGGFVGAICAAPMILGKRGYLEGKSATCYPGFEEYLYGAKLSAEDAVRDGRIVTSRCMGTVMPFALELVECLYGREKRCAVEASVNGRA